MNRPVLSALALAALVTYACGPRARSAEPERKRAPNGVRPHSDPTLTPFAVAFDVKIRDGIEFDFRVTNNTPRKLELLFPTGQTHEVVVVDSLGREVWRWSAGRMFTQSIQNKLVESTATLAWQAAWRAEVPTGRYVAIASLLSENKPLEERVAFEVR